jgi:LruC domain-containing protein
MLRFALTLAAVTLPTTAFALDSVQLTDVVKSNGVGSVDFLKDVTPADLEAFRQEGSGQLMLAIDVNEAAEGTEKSSSQAVTLASVVLSVTTGGVTTDYTVYETATQAVVAPAGTLNRLLYFTAIGDTGSNRITSNAIQNTFDSVLKIQVGQDLSVATAVTAEIVFLDTNVSLGDPEAFYDFSNGFEDLALLNLADSVFLEDLAPGQDEAPAVILTNPPVGPDLAVASWVSHPNATGFYTVGYEDLFPLLGDYDFNDLLVSYRVNLGFNQAGDVVAVNGVAFLVARGAGYSHDWRLRIGFTGATPSGTHEVTLTDPTLGQLSSSVDPFSGDLDLLLFADTRARFPPNPGFSYTNTEPGSTFALGPRVDFSVALDAPVPASAVSAGPFDPYLVVRNTNYEVHLVGESPTAGSRNASEGLNSFKDPNGYPFAFLFPLNWSLPWENTDLRLAYPRLLDYVQSGEQTFSNWYTLPDTALVRGYLQSDWDWAP